MKFFIFLYLYILILIGIKGERLKFLSHSNSIENSEVEKCVACRFIWENIGEALGSDNRNAVITAEAFQYFCKIAPDVFFTPCNEMFERLFEMSEDFTKKNINCAEKKIREKLEN